MCLVEKSRYIQLHKADFNFFQQFIFGIEAMNALIDNGFLPEEHFIKKGSTAEDAKFDKTLTEDLSRQARYLMAVVSVDTAQCYDIVNHVIMALMWYALIRKLGPITVLLTCLHTTRFFQRTGCGDSATFLDGQHLLKYLMGLGQGSRDVPSSWIQPSSVIIHVLKSLDCGAMIVDPITRNAINTTGSMFIDGI